jgi:hypothetical protein
MRVALATMLVGPHGRACVLVARKDLFCPLLISLSFWI